MRMELRLPVPLLVVLLSLVCSSFGNKRLQMGVNYGQLGNNLRSSDESVQLLLSMGARSVKIYDANPKILRSLRDTGLRVSLMIPNELIVAISDNQSAADGWVRSNVVPFYPETWIRYLLVGNEITSIPDEKIWLALVPAIRKIRKSLVKFGLGKIKVGTPIAMDAIESSSPPSNASFRSDLANSVIKPLLQFIERTHSFFFLDVYPYFAWSADPNRIDLNYALLEPTDKNQTDPATKLVYTNLFDQQLDSVYSAMRRLGFCDVRIAIAETGWPNAGDYDQVGANVYNAATYNRNVVRLLLSRAGTPARKKPILVAFLFALYNENQKPGPSTERHFGLRLANGKAVYPIDLTGRKAQYPPLPTPTNNKPYDGQIWCVAAKGANQTALAAAMSWTCGQGNGTCDAIQPTGKCGGLNLTGKASFAFSSYWAQFRKSGGTCYFTGLAVQTLKDPKNGSCVFSSVNPKRA